MLDLKSYYTYRANCLQWEKIKAIYLPYDFKFPENVKDIKQTK